MKLLNRTLVYLSGALLLALTCWAVIFYVNMIDEVHDSIDDGLGNSKLLVIHAASLDSLVLAQETFDEGNYSIREVSAEKAKYHKDIYADTLMYMENEQDFEPVRILTTVFAGTNGRYYQLKVISSMVEEDDLIEDLFYSLLWLYIILIVSILVINNYLLRRIWKPFYNLLNKLKGFRLGSHALIEPEVTSTSEFKMLNDTILEVLQSNVDVFNNQKQLIENASHELQTPLAIALNKLQLFADKHTLTEEQLDELFQVVRALERLTRLNKSLLLLSKIENRQFFERSEVNFNELCRELADDFSDVADHKGIVIDIHEKGVLVRKTHRDLALILLTNLIKNALVHNVKNGTLRIVITATTLVVENTGEPASLDVEKVFRRFYKGSSENKSTGLGLAIVRSICESEHIAISYSFNGLHRMTLEFN